MPDRGKFSLDDYITVPERVTAFYEKFPDGSLQSEIVELSDHLVVMRAYAYRTEDDTRPGIGYSSLGIPGTTPYTRGSEVENCETSAWGRAIAALGFEVKRGIASQEEVRNKTSQDGGVVPDPKPKVPTNGDGSLIGTAELARDFPDFLPKQTPDGHVLAFKLTSTAGGIKVIATGTLAETLAPFRDEVIGQRVSCWGRVRDETFTPKGSKKPVTYQILDLERIRTPTFDLPMITLPTAEAPSVPLFDDEEQAALDAAMDAL